MSSTRFEVGEAGPPALRYQGATHWRSNASRINDRAPTSAAKVVCKPVNRHARTARGSGAFQYHKQFHLRFRHGIGHVHPDLARLDDSVPARASLGEAEVHRVATR